MKTAASLSAAAVVLALQVNGTPLQERAITCDSILPQMQSNIAQANRFCNVYLQIAPQTVTNTLTATSETVTVTSADYTTTTSMVTPATAIRQLRTTTKVTSTVTPSARTVTNTKTSTAYMDPYGSTIAVMKREAEPSKVELAARALVTPAYFKTMRKTDIRAACLCLNLPTPKITRVVTAAATATATQRLLRTIRLTSTVPRATTTTVLTLSNPVTVTAAAPVVLETAYTIVPKAGCPPGQTSTWVCPDMTASDDGNDPNFKNCGVVAQDGYQGYCLYWEDDGSPAASTLIHGDGSGDPDNDQKRPAIYGDDETDDCPSWADWTCAASTGGNAKRSMLEIASDAHQYSRRGFAPKHVSLAAHRAAGPRKMPKGLRRGGKFRKTH